MWLQIPLSYTPLYEYNAGYPYGGTTNTAAPTHYGGAEVFATITTYRVDSLIKEFDDMVNQLNEKVNDDKKFDEYWTPRLTEIIERYLGKGKKVNQCTRAQVEALDLIVSDLREVIKNV